MVNYATLAADYARYRQVHPEVLRQLLSASKITSNSKVLEVGCGTGNYIARIRQATACACWGVDPSEQMLEAARSRDPGMILTLGHAEKLHHPAGFFDLVFSVDVIHHLADPAAYFTSSHRVLETGGRLCTVTDSEWIIRNRRPLSEYFPGTIEPELRRYPALDRLRAGMDQAGFGEIRDELVEYSYSLHDISAYRAKAFSALHLISQEAFESGLARMEADLENGPLACVSRYVLLWGVRI